MTCIGTYQRTIKLYDQLTDKGRKADQSKKHAQENPKMLKMHRLLLNCDNHAQKGEMQQSHEHRWGLAKRILVITQMIPRQNLQLWQS